MNRTVAGSLGRLGVVARRAVQVRASTRDSKARAAPPQGSAPAEMANENKVSTEFYEAQEVDGVFPKRDPGDFPEVGHHLTSEVAAAPAEEEFDPLRDGPARYLGYANELGEAFRAWLPFWGVPASYAVAIAYVVTDTFDKASKANAQARADLADPKIPAEVDTNRLVATITAERFIDTLVWQLLASVAVPGFTIHTVVDIVHHGVDTLLLGGAGNDLNALPTAAAAAVATVAASTSSDQQTVLDIFTKTVPTMAGLGTIPFIVHPIDNLIHWIMNKSIRPAFQAYICGPCKGSVACLDICDTCVMSTEESAKAK